MVILKKVIICAIFIFSIAFVPFDAILTAQNFKISNSNFLQSANCASIFKKSQKKNTKNVSTEANNAKKVQKGYSGNLPEISKFLEYKKTTAQSSIPKTMTIEELDKLDFQQAPLDDALFLDVIIKKQKTSEYIDDLLIILKVMENFRAAYARGMDIQHFNASVNVFDLYAQKIRRKYSTKTEGMTKSYKMLMNLDYNAKILGNLKHEANYMTKFQPIMKHEYSKEYLDAQDKKLLLELDKTIFQVKTECENAKYGEK